MELKTAVTEKEPGVFTVAPTGSVDSNTYEILQKALKPLLDKPAKAIVIDMTGVNYISSMGLSVIFKAKKVIGEKGGTLVLTNIQPRIKRVFDAIKAVPEWIFQTMEEADVYLDSYIDHHHKTDGQDS